MTSLSTTVLDQRTYIFVMVKGSRGETKKIIFGHLISATDIQAAEIIDSSILEFLVLCLRSKVGRVKRFAAGEPHGLVSGADLSVSEERKCTDGSTS